MSLDLAVFDSIIKEHYKSVVAAFDENPAFALLKKAKPPRGGLYKWVSPIDGWAFQREHPHITASEPSIAPCPVIELRPPTDEEIVAAIERDACTSERIRARPEMKRPDGRLLVNVAGERFVEVPVIECRAAWKRSLAARIEVSTERKRRDQLVWCPIIDGDEVGAKDAESVLGRMASPRR